MGRDGGRYNLRGNAHLNDTRFFDRLLSLLAGRFENKRGRGRKEKKKKRAEDNDFLRFHFEQVSEAQRNRMRWFNGP